MNKTRPQKKRSGTAADAAPSVISPNEMKVMLQQEMPDVLQRIPQNDQNRLLKAVARQYQITTSTTHCGPIPSPEQLEIYNRVIPDGANRIMRMAENQSEHRIELEKAVVRRQMNQSACGQWFALGIASLGILSSAYMAVNGAQTAASVVGGATLASMVIAFITGKRSQHRSLTKKQPTR